VTGPFWAVFALLAAEHATFIAGIARGNILARRRPPKPKPKEQP
jgi:hypothetical protein